MLGLDLGARFVRGAVCDLGGTIRARQDVELTVRGCGGAIDAIARLRALPARDLGARRRAPRRRRRRRSRRRRRRRDAQPRRERRRARRALVRERAPGGPRPARDPRERHQPRRARRAVAGRRARSRRLRLPLGRHRHGRRARARRRAPPRAPRSRRRDRLRARRARRDARSVGAAGRPRWHDGLAGLSRRAARRLRRGAQRRRAARWRSSTRSRDGSRSTSPPIAAVVDVELVVLGGGIGANGDLLLAPVSRLLAEWLPFPPRVEVSTLGEAAVLTGAVAVGLHAALENVFAASAGLTARRAGRRPLSASRSSSPPPRSPSSSAPRPVRPAAPASPARGVSESRGAGCPFSIRSRSISSTPPRASREPSPARSHSARERVDLPHRRRRPHASIQPEKV